MECILHSLEITWLWWTLTVLEERPLDGGTSDVLGRLVEVQIVAGRKIQLAASPTHITQL
jgi:hypothetical protein